MGRRGSLLVVTLWLVTVLSLLAVALAGYLSTEMRLTRYYRDRTQAKAWARAGVHLALERLAADLADTAETHDWLGDGWAIPVQPSGEEPSDEWTVPVPPVSDESSTAPDHVAIRITDEERRLDVNTAPDAQLEAFLGEAELAQAIAEYRDADDEGPDESVQPPYQPKNGPIRAVAELWQIPRVAAARDQVAEALDEHAAIHTDGALNINTVTAPVLTAVSGDAALADALVHARPGADGVLGTDDDCVAKSVADAAAELAPCANIDPVVMASLMTKAKFDVRSSIFRIRATSITERTAVRATVEAVVRRSGGQQSGTGVSFTAAGQSFEVLSWRES